MRQRSVCIFMVWAWVGCEVSPSDTALRDSHHAMDRDAGAVTVSDSRANMPVVTRPTEDGAQGTARDASAMTDIDAGSPGMTVEGTAADQPVDSQADPPAVPLDPPGWLASEPLCVMVGREVVHQPEVIGADMGVSYAHEGRIEWLFGDTWATERPPTRNDDAFASLYDIADGVSAEKHCAQNKLPLQLGASPSGELLPIDAGPLMDGFKAPVVGFSWGGQEYAIFFFFKPQDCETDSDCVAGLRCELDLGFIGVRPSVEQDFTLPCKDGTLACTANTVTGRPSGLCVDPELYPQSSDASLVASAAMYIRFGLRSKEDRSQYESWPYLTARMQNMTAALVGEDFRRPPTTAEPARVLLFGRSGFVTTAERPALLYLAYADLPWREKAPELHFFVGVDGQGQPQFSSNERDAVPLDLHDGLGDPTEIHDVVHQQTVRYIPELGRWVMFYGGGVSTLPRVPLARCGVAEVFAPSDCEDIRPGNGAIRVRWADVPWGPWSAPVDILVAGDALAPETLTDAYAPYGLLRHPACVDEGCAPHQGLPNFVDDEYGFFYGPNIVDQWTRVEEDRVALYWNVSTWDPYRIVLMKTSFSLSADAVAPTTPPPGKR